MYVNLCSKLPHFPKRFEDSDLTTIQFLPVPLCLVIGPKETQSVNENFLPAAMFATESVLPGQAKPNSVDESDTKLGEIYKEITNPLKQASLWNPRNLTQKSLKKSSRMKFC